MKANAAMDGFDFASLAPCDTEFIAVECLTGSENLRWMVVLVPFFSGALYGTK